MPPPPVDDHTEEFEQLAGLRALDVLEDEDLQRFEQHAARCERCRLMVQLDREALALAAPEMEPSPDFRARLMQRAAQELGEDSQTADARRPADLGERPQVVQARPADLGDGLEKEAVPANVIPLRRRAPWLSAIAAVLVLGLVTTGGYAYENQVIASYALAGSASGSAVVTVRRSGATELDMNAVPDPAPGFVYEAWIIPANSQPIAAGTTSSGDARLPLDHLTGGTTVAVTQERTRVDAPTSSPIMAVVVPA